jgi:hypothetical protein
MNSRGSVKKTHQSRTACSVDLGDVIGPEWAEVEAGPAGLTLPGWRRPFDPGELRAMFQYCRQVELLQIENARLRKERAEAWQRAEAAEDRAEWYRQQLRLESRLGAMLVRLAV